MKMSKFNCVELKHRGAEKVIEKTSQMTMTQELEFWRERTQNLITQKKSIKQKRNQRVNA
jgi:hypothetical protein